MTKEQIKKLLETNNVSYTTEGASGDIFIIENSKFTIKEILEHTKKFGFHSWDYV